MADRVTLSVKRAKTSEITVLNIRKLYLRQTNHTIAWDNSKIITTNRRYGRYHQRCCLEAWHINSAHAPLNRDDGGLLPDAYLYEAPYVKKLCGEF